MTALESSGTTAVPGLLAGIDSALQRGYIDPGVW
jgi:hypothetical protein